MLNVSAAWQEASKAQFRYQAYLSATLEVTPPGLRQGATISSDYTDTNSDADVIMDGDSTAPVWYGSLEPNRLVLDGSVRLLSKSTKTKDWWANQSGEITIHFEFDKPYSIPGIYAQWDIETNSWPTSLTVKGYDNSGTQQYSIDISDINSSTGFYEFEMQNVKSVDLIVVDWSTPDWVARINELVFGLYATFESENNGRISGATLTNKSDPLSESLPVHTASITFRNSDQYFDPELKTGISPYIAQQQIMKLKWSFNIDYDTRESSENISYLVSSIDIPQDSKDVTINFTDRLAMLTQDFKKGTYTGSKRSLKDIAEYILQNSNVLTSEDGEIPWIIPDVLSECYTTAPIPAKASNVLLQYLALASCTWLTTDATTGFIKFVDKFTNRSLIPDPSMQDLTGWTTIWKPDYSAENGIMTIVSGSDIVENGSGGYVAMRAPYITPSASHIYYSSCYVYNVNNPNSITMSLYVVNGTTYQGDISKSMLKWVKISCITEKIASGRYAMYPYMVNMGLVKEQGITVKMTKPIFVDLTEIFGAGNEPTKEWCDEHIQLVDNKIVVVYDKITKTQEQGDPSFTIQDKLRSISFAVNHYNIDSESKQIAKGDYTITGEQVLELKYNVDYATEVSTSISGATLISADCYNSYAILKVKAATDNASVSITLTGKEIVNDVTYVETFRDTNVSNGNDVTIENPFITDTTSLQKLSDYIRKYYNKQVAYTVPYTGYVYLEPTDAIDLKTVYGEGVVELTNNTITFNGAWNGTAEAK